MNSKRKGSAGERELEQILAESGIRAVRNDQRYISGKNNPDISVEFAGEPVHVEVKRAEHLNITKAVNQAVSDADGKAFPVVVHRTNRQPWLVTFRLDDFLRSRDAFLTEIMPMISSESVEAALQKEGYPAEVVSAAGEAWEQQDSKSFRAALV